MNIVKLLMGLAAATLLVVGSANAATIDLLHSTDTTGPVDSSTLTYRGALIGDESESVKILGAALGTGGNHQFQFTVSDPTDLVLDFALFTGGSTFGSPSPKVTLSDLSGVISPVDVALGASDTISGLVATQIYQLDLVGNVSLYDLNLTAVPLPAAVWLFGSALVGFGFLSRRKSA